MGIKVNLTQDEIKAAQSGLPPALPEGIYAAQIYTSVSKDSKAGKPMYEIDFKITDGPAGVGRKQRGWFSLAPNALFSTIALLKALDLPYPTKETPEGEFEFPDAEEFLGERVNIKLVKEPYLTLEENEDGEEVEVTAFRNGIKRVTKFDIDKVTDAEDAEDGAAAGGVFL